MSGELQGVTFNGELHPDVPARGVLCQNNEAILGGESFGLRYMILSL